MDSFTGEIRIFGFNFAPSDWAMCNGTTVLIAQYQMLAAIIGTIFGGDGRTTIGLPNLMSRSVMGVSPSYQLGAAEGAESVTLATSQMPNHTHDMNYIKPKAGQMTDVPTGNWLSHLVKNSPTLPLYKAYADGTTKDPNTTLHPVSLSIFPGTSGAHENRQPYLAMNFCISLNGNFPPRP